LEIVIVIVVLGIIAAIAVLRMSRAAEGSADAALTRDLRTLRQAIELYRVEHDGLVPPGPNVELALTGYSNREGTIFGPTAAAPVGAIYGPYLQQAPPLPVGNRKGASAIATNSGDSVGWVYDADDGMIRANCGPSERDAAGKAYRDY